MAKKFHKVYINPVLGYNKDPSKIEPLDWMPIDPLPLTCESMLKAYYNMYPALKEYHGAMHLKLKFHKEMLRGRFQTITIRGKTVVFGMN